MRGHRGVDALRRRSSCSARSMRCRARVAIRRPDDQLAERGCRSTARRVALSYPPSQRTPGPDGTRSSVIVPGEGRKPLAEFSALMRTSIECPWRTMSSCVNDSGSPDATRICSATRSSCGDHLGDAVLDLEPGVHLEEVELAVLVRASRRCRRSRSRVAFATCTAASPIARRVSSSRPGRGRLLDQLLVPALHRAVALAEPHRVAVGVGEDLHLDVARPGEVLLEVRLGAAEVGLRLARPPSRAPTARARRRRRPSCPCRRRRTRP